jgi:hypothetical protein|tara:strand:- start:159 stop:629 length:471 start_codon:yes stop_codon:yes gene_type:complete
MTTEITLISPEGLEIAHAYLENGSDSAKAAQVLGLPLDEVTRHLSKREVCNYIDRLFNESGFRNRDKMGAVWDAVLQSKLEEMDETGLGSSKDIIEIMEKMHKFNMDQMAMQLKLLEAGEKKDSPLIAIQQNNSYGGDKYNSLLDRILGASTDASK